MFGVKDHTDTIVKKYSIWYNMVEKRNKMKSKLSLDETIMVFKNKFLVSGINETVLVYLEDLKKLRDDQNILKEEISLLKKQLKSSRTCKNCRSETCPMEYVSHGTKICKHHKYKWELNTIRIND